MKRLKLKPNPKDHHWTYTEDIQRILRAFGNIGFQISESDAIEGWERYSDLYLASWLVLPESDTEIYHQLKEFFEEEQ